MAIFRVERTKDYTVMSNYHLRDTNLSLKGKGLLSMMLSLPEDWNYTTRGLAKICKEGVDAISGALRGLEAAGYIIRNRLRDKNGRISDTEYVIYEKPKHKKNKKKTTDKPDTDKPDTDSPCTENPYMVKPDTENPTQLNIEKSNKEKIKTDRLNTDSILFSALSQMNGRLESTKVQLDNLYQQQAAAKDEVGKPFPNETEFQIKSARLI